MERVHSLHLLSGGLLGLEKESLRVGSGGCLSQQPHPALFGSALTHPHITTDYSEALLEFITPPMAGSRQALDYLADLQAYVQQRLGEELLWATSMPCVQRRDDEEMIPIARYGSSNAGRMKHIYRVGLANRYGRMMQIIAGVHVNISLDPKLWPYWQEIRGRRDLSLRALIDDAYMGMLRNLQRFGWLIPYLFGASPAVCKGFFESQPMGSLQVLDKDTYYEPFATSLRLGDIGYQNRREEGVGVKADYDSLSAYVASLAHAIDTPALLWEEIGVRVAGEYRQLSANILQIENEYYSSVRPKQLLDGLEKPIHALSRRGIRYIELRSLDVNVYQPLGVGKEEVVFLRLLAMLSLLVDSPSFCRRERCEVDRNLLQVAHRGREPGLRLCREGQQVPLQTWATEILQAMVPLCDAMGDEADLCRQVLDAQMEKVRDPDVTPSARMLAEMKARGETFQQFARRLSHQHAREALNHFVPPEREREWDTLAGESLRQQQAMEASDEMDFDVFLAAYLAQDPGEPC